MAKKATRASAADETAVLKITDALKRDVMVTTVRSPEQVDVETAAVLGKTKSLSTLRSSLGWK